MNYAMLSALLAVSFFILPTTANAESCLELAQQHIGIIEDQMPEGLEPVRDNEFETLYLWSISPTRYYSLQFAKIDPNIKFAADTTIVDAGQGVGILQVINRYRARPNLNRGTISTAQVSELFVNATVICDGP